jgi:small subunit ribosomal protein S29
MLLVDEYNYYFTKTTYPSFKYVNYKDVDGTIPPYDIALARLFMKFDGHRIKNGVKVMATTEYRFKRRTFSPTNINLPPRVCFELEKLAIDDFRLLLEYYFSVDWMERLSE